MSEQSIQMVRDAVAAHVAEVYPSFFPTAVLVVFELADYDEEVGYSVEYCSVSGTPAAAVGVARLGLSMLERDMLSEGEGEGEGG